jgi:hypothetical protein
VKGVVTIGPTCPGPVRQPADPRCNDRPYEATLRIVRRRSHAFVKRFSSRSDGRYRVHLAAGRYLIENARSNRLPSLAPVPVTVREHRFTSISIQFDSGLR